MGELIGKVGPEITGVIDIAPDKDPSGMGEEVDPGLVAPDGARIEPMWKLDPPPSKPNSSDPLAELHTLAVGAGLEVARLREDLRSTARVSDRNSQA